jgi:LmeA-like phospholipid-binding
MCSNDNPPPADQPRRTGVVRPIGKNVRVRKLLIGVLVTVGTVAVGAVGADFGAAIYAEYRLARTVRSENGLKWDPSVAILGFPFITQAMRRHYDEVEIHASGVDHAVVGKASLETTLHSIDLGDASWLVGPGAKLPVGKVESRIIIDSTHVGRFMGIPDLLVEAPTTETNDPTGGTTESGISSNRGLVFTGTPKAADYDEKVSIAVDLSVSGPEQTTLVFTATGVLTGPGTADQQVPDDKKAAVLAAFSTALPGQKLPFGITPTSEGARGSDIIIEGIAEGVTVALNEFRQ